MQKRVDWKSLIISILIPLAVGALAGVLTMNNVEQYRELVQPPLSPPSAVFPIVWTALYILMGISAYIIIRSDSPQKYRAMTIYAIQLFFNFCWSLIFFNKQNYLLAFVWLVILWLLILAMVISFYRINKTAGLLQIPYLIWVTFAGYLNLGIYLLN